MSIDKKMKTALVANAKERKKRFVSAQGVRKNKQLAMGAGFIGLLAAGWIYPLVGYFIPLCMIFGIGTAIYSGRTWCDWACPRGAFSDTLLKMMSPERKIPEALRSWPARIGMMIFLMG